MSQSEKTQIASTLNLTPDQQVQTLKRGQLFAPAGIAWFIPRVLATTIPRR